MDRTNHREQQKQLNEHYRKLNSIKMEIGFIGYDNLLSVLALNHHNEHTCIIGAPGIGKSSILRFLTSIFSNNHNVVYFSFDSLLQELLQDFELNILDLSKKRVVYDSELVNSIYQNHYLMNSDTELLESFLRFEESIKNESETSLNLNDIKYSDSSIEVLDQIAVALKSAKGSSPGILAIDNIDSVNLLINDPNGCRIDDFVQMLKEVCLTYNFKLITTSTIPFSRIQASYCKPTHWMYVNGGKGLIDSAEQVIFVNRESFYALDANREEMVLHLIKDKTSIDFLRRTSFQFDVKNYVYFLKR